MGQALACQMPTRRRGEGRRGRFLYIGAGRDVGARAICAEVTDARSDPPSW